MQLTQISLNICLALLGLAIASNRVAAEEGSSQAPPLSPEESMATMEIQPGFALVPVLTEPEISEPAAIVWDGNGRMYVVEMRTYMQDIDGTNELAPTSRVSRHEDTNGDGVYDKHTVFADNLVLPRMVLPLLDRVIIGETNTLDLKSYQDTDDDGVADQVELWHEGGPRGGNLEHQPSGLVWNIDNWIYTTYTGYRLRYTDGKVTSSPLIYNAGQWGLTQDNVGRMFYSSAGGENPAYAFQQPIVYGQIDLPGEQAPGFREVYPIDNVPDVQGGLPRVRDDNTLNVFTGVCGQSIFRGDRLPNDFAGDLILCEPVGRLIRRAKVTDENGRITLRNAYDQQEFIAARDPNFRPINSATGPDGCLYLVDMYRGIIQEGAWVREGSYLRGIVEEYELDKNIGRGRIYRVDHESTERGPQPRMLDESPLQLVAHLNHPNGWWRDEAQKLIILHGDNSVIPALEELAHQGDDPLGRLHGYWTLEGLGAITVESLAEGFVDSDARVRAAAMRLAEPFLATDTSLNNVIERLAQDPSPGVVMQTLLSVNQGQHPDGEAITQRIVEANQSNPNVASVAEQYRRGMEALRAEQKKIAEMAQRNEALAASVLRGKVIYSTLCTTCHGEHGKGHPSPQGGDHLAPPLAGSARVQGHKARLLRILLQGLIGPVDDKTYADGLMMPLAANDDAWIADAANYVRNSWDNEGSMIQPQDVERVREESASRIGPWTLADLHYYDPPETKDRSQWKLDASNNREHLEMAIDTSEKTRWDTGTVQKPGQWLSVELPEPVRAMTLVLDTRGSNQDFPRSYLVEVSADGSSWNGPVAVGYGDKPVTSIELDSPGLVRFIRVTQTGVSPNKYWSIHNLQLKAIPADAKPPISLAETLAEISPHDLATRAMAEGDAKRGAELFFNPSISCAKCHEPVSGPRLGPNLAEARDGITNSMLVQSVLEPSQEIHKDFQQVSVITADGLVLRGFPVREDDDEFVIREPAGGKEIVIAQEDIDDVIPVSVSAMPPGLVNQLHDRQQFSDLIRFLIEIRTGGETAMKSFRADSK
ncbi:DUF7133 domain-containing protein [Allorhodopirellula heiligendammensis]|uniref:F5/8 type C domain protein n=1 Tax=Allorhodopirellula heiligendammensis TaxID=2714739 RepID=A0A5C6BUB5_9BACT|nr:discoidin domain-containing protein [Allorhodopirellula heiligendammensis]TWU15595.1 F5/8 type C domain protein [Allorhodopirellula heiligendammensis]